MRILTLALLPALLLAQSAPPAPRDFPKHIERGYQLMEAASLAIPELARAGSPLIETARQANRSYTSPDIRADDSRILLSYITSLRAFLMLTDTLPRPIPFPQEAQRQLVELRENFALADAAFRTLLDNREAIALGSDRDNLKRYAEANSRVGPPATPNRRVVFLGDSITDGWRLNEYFPDRDFINRGISGQITAEMLGRMKQDVIDLKPAAMLVLAGTNDIARGVPLSTMRQNLTLIADLAEFHKIKPMFASLLPVSSYHKANNPRYEMTRTRPMATIRAANEWIKSFCNSRGYSYVDYFTPLVDGNGYLKAEYADDGLHPNSAGYRIMAPVALEAITKTLPSGVAPAKRRK